MTVNQPVLLFATTNRGKFKEGWAVLSTLPGRLVSLNEYPQLAKPLENADTFEGNSRLKALHYARLTGFWTLADDSGLEVDALGGAPGVYSARYAGPACDDAANNAKLLLRLADVPKEKRTARFRCVVTLASPKEVLATSSGVLEGLIVSEARGRNGFGYDPHFFVPPYGMTTAEMPPDQKNGISHRGQALAAIRPQIEQILARSAP